MFHSAFLTSAVAVLMVFSAPWAYSATTEELMRMTDQMDQMDRLDFQAHLDQASQCARTRDLVCAETQLGKAAKSANGAKDKNSLASARESLLAVRKQIAHEAAVLAEREAELERREARYQEQQEEAQRQARRRARESDDASSTASTIALFGSLVASNYANLNARRSVEDATAQRRFDDMQSGVAKNIARDQQRFAQERAQIQAQRDALQRQSQTARAPVLAAMPPPVAPRPVAAPAPDTRNAYNLPPGSPGNSELAQIGARAAGIDLASLDRKSGAREPEVPRNPFDSGSRPAVSLAPVAPAAGSTRTGTMYFHVHAWMRHSRSLGGDAIHHFEENVIPVEWRWVNSNAGSRTDEIMRKARPLVLEAFRDHLSVKFPPCKTGVSTPNGCWAVQRYVEYGNTPDEVRAKLEQAIRQAGGSQKVVREASFSYRTAITYED